jgi:hypothetical protein
VADWTRTDRGSYALHLPGVSVYLCPTEDPTRWLVSCHELGIEREPIEANGLKSAVTTALELARGRAKRLSLALENVANA